MGSISKKKLIVGKKTAQRDSALKGTKGIKDSKMDFRSWQTNGSHNSQQRFLGTSWLGTMETGPVPELPWFLFL